MPKHELRLLALDGGGVRGLSMLQILKQLMNVVDPESPPKPCDYFDMIGGTSTGGLVSEAICDTRHITNGYSLVAIMLGRLQMTIDDCIDAYISLSDRVFQKRRHRVTIKGNVQGRFDSDELERAIKEIVVRQGLEEDALLKHSRDAKCKVFVCATSKETGDTVRLTSYRSPRGRERLLRTAKIWEAGRATSAASSFFDPITIGDFNEGFIDGAIGANNPVYELWNEAQDIWPSGLLEDNVRCLVSIGTGLPSLKPFTDDLISVGQSLLAIATETEKTAERFSRDKSGLDDKGRYYRFNVLRGLEDVGLEDSKGKNVTIAATDRYVESQAIFKQMKACAKNLSDELLVQTLDNNPEQTRLRLLGIPEHAMLSWAVHNGRVAAVNELLSQNAINFDVNVKGEYPMAPLTFAAQEGFTSIVEILLRHGANPNAQDSRCRTALSYAAQEGHYDVLEHLLSHSADSNIVDDEGGTALLWGACRGKEAIVRRLIAVEGVDMNPVDYEGMSPLMWAIERRHGKIAEIIANSLPFSKARLVEEVFKWRVLRVKSVGP
ncbi:hypothetical protein OEA41_010297 [Lepraria neglecta]|uniref:phospholipase A2 n=1 Tax=Lepraria neglecta TaxID=209136 RepID=A0AAE0DF00_9LECA|nr:hypothetical protein OEA41_010297 [Lepraria neglecta]